MSMGRHQLIGKTSEWQRMARTKELILGNGTVQNPEEAREWLNASAARTISPKRFERILNSKRMH
jgi:2-keto-3-deoxy-6-phosphogluconate aldolase